VGHSIQRIVGCRGLPQGGGSNYATGSLFSAASIGVFSGYHRRAFLRLALVCFYSDCSRDPRPAPHFCSTESRTDLPLAGFDEQPRPKRRYRRTAATSLINSHKSPIGDFFAVSISTLPQQDVGDGDIACDFKLDAMLPARGAVRYLGLLWAEQSSERSCPTKSQTAEIELCVNGNELRQPIFHADQRPSQQSDKQEQNKYHNLYSAVASSIGRTSPAHKLVGDRQALADKGSIPLESQLNPLGYPTCSRLASLEASRVLTRFARLQAIFTYGI
jgi:hypothetical protein